MNVKAGSTGTWGKFRVCVEQVIADDLVVHITGVTGIEDGVFDATSNWHAEAGVYSQVIAAENFKPDNTDTVCAWWERNFGQLV